MADRFKLGKNSRKSKNSSSAPASLQSRSFRLPSQSRLSTSETKSKLDKPDQSECDKIKGSLKSNIEHSKLSFTAKPVNQNNIVPPNPQSNASYVSSSEFNCQSSSVKLPSQLSTHALQPKKKSKVASSSYNRNDLSNSGLASVPGKPAYSQCSSTLVSPFSIKSKPLLSLDSFSQNSSPPNPSRPLKASAPLFNFEKSTKSKQEITITEFNISNSPPWDGLAREFENEDEVNNREETNDAEETYTRDDEDATEDEFWNSSKSRFIITNVKALSLSQDDAVPQSREKGKNGDRVTEFHGKLIIPSTTVESSLNVFQSIDDDMGLLAKEKFIFPKQSRSNQKLNSTMQEGYQDDDDESSATTSQFHKKFTLPSSNNSNPVNAVFPPFESPTSSHENDVSSQNIPKFVVKGRHDTLFDDSNGTVKLSESHRKVYTGGVVTQPRIDESSVGDSNSRRVRNSSHANSRSVIYSLYLEFTFVSSVYFSLFIPQDRLLRTVSQAFESRVFRLAILVESIQIYSQRYNFFPLAYQSSLPFLH
ncbi:hypothetical protein BKA69DRAFT_456454 [Paraphysoderma sedebokerense]|nr:hypothetical protein BKA69DRAFT_456454 [Paraphysoderma sedebokerense]